MVWAFQDQLAILDDLDATIAGRGEPLLEWVILDINANASVTGVLASRPRSERVPDNHADYVQRIYRNGWRVIEDEARTPEYYSERSLKASKHTLSLIGKHGVTGYALSDDGHSDAPTDLTPRGAVNLDLLMRPGAKSYGSVEGKLSVISVKNEKHPKFEVVTSLAKKAVSCKFDPSLLDDVKAALGRRVVVTGEITHNAKGEPHRIAMDRPIRLLRSEAELPSTLEMSGAFPDLTGDMTTAQYMELIRG